MKRAQSSLGYLILFATVLLIIIIAINMINGHFIEKTANETISFGIKEVGKKITDKLIMNDTGG
ncbi:hypothetical protein PNA2_1427 [Pyrococcus sp. NA2]|uniref:hypothetical protein n=1 Tax=Pyrococcus sp. (strain NA2) TaxID=342949 RepID=UPI000209AF24|nr:hypothetical protein [Pyrococcus sp. NA2]AEC52342.1 hypothetical protein PNA2_1427 [Pyrococcus sp. NA2]